MHWLDFDRLAEKIVEVFPAGATSLAVTGYLPAQIMNQNILNNDIFGGSSLNVHGELRGISFHKIKVSRAEVSTLKNAKLCKIGVECVEFM